MDKIFIIAEAGVNHNGDIKIAKRMVDIAVNAGASAVKFQTFKAEEVVTRTASKAGYQINRKDKDESQFAMLKRLELSESHHEKLMGYCAKRGIVFMSTPFDEKSADLLDRLGMTIFKVPSGEITNRPLIQHIAKKGKPMILSTGMAYLKEVKRAIGWVSQTWRSLRKAPPLTLLHCVSNYPAVAEEINLKAMITLRSAFGLPVGYSDHTMGTEISIAAVAMGAEVIEKHFTLDRGMSGPDHKASLEPDELRAMVAAIRNVEKAFGDGVKRPTNSEKEMMSVIRRSLVAAKDIRAGDTIRMVDIAIKRPGTGLAPDLIGLLVDKKARVDIKKDTLLKEEHLL